MGRGQLLYAKARKIIPGGTQLFSKRPERFLPGLWPAYFSRARGCEVWDLDNVKYTDMSTMGVGSCVLGYAEADVNRAVKAAIDRATMATLNCPEEVELAGVLCRLHPWASMARFARTGGEAMAVAVRVVRACTGKDEILFCGYHGWHDWYLSANLGDRSALDGHLASGLQTKGVPQALGKTAFSFAYNDTAAFLRLFKQRGSRLAAVVMEPVRNYPPVPGFLQTIRQATAKKGVALVFDEITAGWRLANGGAHLLYHVYPDIAVFGKAMSNGYPMAAVAGKPRFMEGFQDSFISSTYWTERIGPVAALATIRKFGACKVHRHLGRIGERVQSGWKTLARKHGLDINVTGIFPLGHFFFKDDASNVLKTLFTQEMLAQGFLAGTAFYASYAHEERHIDRYISAVDRSFGFIARAKKGDARRFLKGEPCQSDFRRLT